MPPIPLSLSMNTSRRFRSSSADGLPSFHTKDCLILFIFLLFFLHTPSPYKKPSKLQLQRVSSAFEKALAAHHYCPLDDISMNDSTRDKFLSRPNKHIPPKKSTSESTDNARAATSQPRGLLFPDSRTKQNVDSWKDNGKALNKESQYLESWRDQKLEEFSDGSKTIQDRLDAGLKSGGYEKMIYTNSQKIQNHNRNRPWS